MSPEKIMLSPEGGFASIKLIDFGMATEIGTDFKKVADVVSTPYYLAPEMLNGEYDEKVDVWSIGVIAYEMMTGKLPFNGRKKEEICNKILNEDVKFDQKVSAEGQDFILSLLSKDPESRPCC